MIFDPAGEDQADPVDLRGGARAPRRFIGWQTFFDFGAPFTGDVRPNKVIDTKISTPLFNLPLGAIPSGDPPTALPQRNLLRHLTWSIPSGQRASRSSEPRSVTRVMPLHIEAIAELGDTAGPTYGSFHSVEGQRLVDELDEIAAQVSACAATAAERAALNVGMIVIRMLESIAEVRVARGVRRGH